MHERSSGCGPCLNTKFMYVSHTPDTNRPKVISYNTGGTVFSTCSTSADLRTNRYWLFPPPRRAHLFPSEHDGSCTPATSRGYFEGQGGSTSEFLLRAKNLKGVSQPSESILKVREAVHSSMLPRQPQNTLKAPVARSEIRGSQIRGFWHPQGFCSQNLYG